MNMKTVQELLGDNPTIWVFGYGSLLWKPDFRFKSKKIGYVKDYERRFYQGNITFRGRPGQPGRVANLVEKKGSRAWGVAYEISGREEVTQVLQALYTRETASGGYVTLVTTFYPRDERTNKNLATTNRTHRSTDSDSEFTKPLSSVSTENSHDLHKFPARLDRPDSDMSIDESSSDEDLSDLVHDNSQNGYYLSNNRSHSEVQFQVDNQIYPLTDSNNNVDSLLQYIHGVSGESRKVEKPHVDVETGERFHNLSLSNEPSIPHETRTEDTNGRLNSLPVQVLLYTATSDNDLYLGPDDITSMARQIVNASGSAGSNVEYVTKIADYVRKYIPEDQDSHLFNLDAKVREEVYRQHAMDSTRLQLGFADLLSDLHDIDQNVIIKPVMAS